jgi:ribulose-5-phosphate 4-epimerase/fuculose-1-phosphate aldolase
LTAENAVRERICRFARSLFERGLTPGSSGNISVRLSDGGFLVTPTDASLGFLDPAELCRLDDSGVAQGGRPPTKELPLHAALYDSRSATAAVVHLHSTHAVALSTLHHADPENVLPPLTAYSLMRVGRLALLPYFRPGDPAVAEAIRALAGRHACVLLANHGPVVAGTSLESAVYAIEELEETAKLVLLLRDFHPRMLSPTQIAELVDRFELDPALSRPRAEE